MGSRRNRECVGDVNDVAQRPTARQMLTPLKHDPEGLELVARMVEVLAARSRAHRRS